jgi:iron complex outermembrane receptor protein
MARRQGGSAAKFRAMILAALVLAMQGPDTIPRDTVQRVMLPPVTVSVTRSPESRGRLPLAVGVLDSGAIRGAQLTVGLDESLSRLPGVVVLNRYNYSLDQRISLRGAGSRANFGLRGVKVLIDGIPQTLPDGQSQLTNLELGTIDRVEVLTGSAGALYGNASGGVLSFSTETPLLPWTARLRMVGGSFGTWKAQSVLGAARGPLRALGSLSRFETGGFRQHSAAAAWQLVGKLDYDLSERSSLGLRFSAADAPRAEHPGALTFDEYQHTRDSAAASNLLRGADKSVAQQQASLRYRWQGDHGWNLEAGVFGLLRDLANPLATPPPTPPALTARTGTYSTIDRRVGGFRVAGTVPLLTGSQVLRLALGMDLQAMRDHRRNLRSYAGRPLGSPFVDQVETVAEMGPYAQLHWEPVRSVLLLGAARYDRLVFRVNDRLRLGGVDRGGERTMSNPSGSLGVSVALAPALTVYANGSTSFESPTTTELVNTTGSLGFNTTLEPQRTRSGELGIRGRLGDRLDWSLTGFASRIRDAIIQAREVDGRAFFENAGRVRVRGIEGGLGADPLPWLSLRAAYTLASYRFAEYRIRNGATTDTLDGNRLAGVPRHFFRGSLAVRHGPVRLELEELTAGSVYGDDRNTLRVEGWGPGVTTVRLEGDWLWGSTRLRPFVTLHNLFDRKYVGSVNLNGAGGRVLEPAPGRSAYGGLELGLRPPSR